MILFAALNFAVVASYFTARRLRLDAHEWLFVLILWFLGFWSGFEFWFRVAMWIVGA